MLVGKELGPFRIEKELGSGAMGTVYRAENRDTGQKVAIKMIGIGQLNNETAIARFEREANILKQLKHPNIVRLIGNGRWKKMPFIAMEYVEGESLDHVLARRAGQARRTGPPVDGEEARAPPARRRHGRGGARRGGARRPRPALGRRRRRHRSPR